MHTLSRFRTSVSALLLLTRCRPHVAIPPRAAQCLEACVTECVPPFRAHVAQKRIPDAMAALVLSRDADTSVREKAAALVAHWGVHGGAHAAFAEALERLRMEGVPIDGTGRGFAAWLANRERLEASAAAAAAAARKGLRANLRAGGGGAGGGGDVEEDLILPVGKDGRQRGRDAEEAAAAPRRRGGSAATHARWNAAGRPARGGPEGDDRYRTGTGGAPRRSRADGDSSSDEEEEEEADEGAEASAWSGRARSASRRPSSASPRPAPRPPGMPQGISRHACCAHTASAPRELCSSRAHSPLRFTCAATCRRL
jgi:hypothetical protein